MVYKETEQKPIDIKKANAKKKKKHPKNKWELNAHLVKCPLERKHFFPKILFFG